MKFSKAYLNENIEKESIFNRNISDLYVVAFKLLEAIDSAIDPVEAYRFISQNVNSGNVDMNAVFTPQHLRAFEQIKEKHAFGLPISNIINTDNTIQTQILSAYNRLKRYMEVQSDERSQPTNEVSKKFDYDGMKDVFTSLHTMLSQYLEALELMKQQFDVLFPHIPVSRSADELKTDVEKIYNYLKHELSVTNESLKKGTEGILDFQVDEKANTSAAEPAVNPPDWPRKLKRSADAKTLMFHLLQNWYDKTNKFQEGIDNLWKHYFFEAKDKKDLSRQIVQNLSKSKDSKDKRNLWEQFSNRLNEITESFSQGKTPYSGKNKPFDTELLADVHRILKWNMVKIIGDINIAKSDLHRLTDQNTNPLTRQTPKEKEQAPLDVYRVPFQSFYKQFTDKMRKVDEYLSNSMEKIQELISQVPNTNFNNFLDIMKKVDEIVGTGYQDIMTIKFKYSPRTAQEVDQSQVAMQQLVQYVQNFKTNYAKIEKFLHQAHSELDRISLRTDLSPEDSEQAKEIMVVFQDMLNALREQRMLLDKFIKDTEEAGKTTTQKVEEFITKNPEGTPKEQGNKLYNWFMSGGGVGGGGPV